MLKGGCPSVISPASAAQFPSCTLANSAGTLRCSPVRKLHVSCQFSKTSIHKFIKPNTYLNRFYPLLNVDDFSWIRNVPVNMLAYDTGASGDELKMVKTKLELTSLKKSEQLEIR